MILKVLSYNIHKGFNFTGRDFTLRAIREALRETQCDLLLLQEVVGHNSNFARNIQDWPTQAQFEFLADEHWHHYSYGKNAVFPERHHGNAILSKFPIVAEDNLNISMNKWEQRGLLHCEIAIPPLEKSLHVFNTHIDLLEHSRRKQIQKILARCRDHVPANLPFLFAGDFNDWTQNIHSLILEQMEVQEGHTLITGKPAKSFPSFFPTLTLDRIYCRHVLVRECRTLKGAPWTKLSDHLPLYAEFDIT